MSFTDVTTVRGTKPEDHDPGRFVYVGRAVRYTEWKASKWGNPFRGEGAVAKFFEWIQLQPQLLEQLPELRGKTLGCWCCHWSPGQPMTVPCHAIILARMADLPPLPQFRAGEEIDITGGVESSEYIRKQRDEDW